MRFFISKKKRSRLTSYSCPIDIVVILIFLRTSWLEISIKQSYCHPFIFCASSIIRTILRRFECPSERIPELPSEAQINSDQLQLAQQLIKNLSSSKTDESQFINVGQVRMESLIQSKISGQEVIQIDSEKNESHHIIDLMEALQMSITLLSNPSTKKNKQKKKESAS